MQRAIASKTQWQEARDYFLQDRVDLSDTTLKNYMLVLSTFFRDCRNPISGVTRTDILTFLQRYTKASTYNTRVTVFKSFFKWASDIYGFNDPAAKLRKRKLTEPYEARIITDTEYSKIKAQHGVVRDTAVLIANTGLRVSELLGNPDVNLKKRYIHIIGKGAKPRTIPINQTAFEVLQKTSIDLIKSTLKTPNKVYVKFYSMASNLHIRPFGPHALRHYFCTRLLDKGVPVATVAALMGHSDPRTTLSHYYHPQQLDSAVGLLDNSF